MRKLRAGAVVCALAGVGLAGLPGLLGRPAPMISGDLARNDRNRVTANVVEGEGIATRAGGELSGNSGTREPRDVTVAPAKPNTGLEDAEEITLRASLEPVIEELALEEWLVSPAPANIDDPEMITLRASLEPVLEESVR